MGSSRKFTFTIKRTGGDSVDFTLELEEGLTVLDALEEIRFTMDSTLQYRHSCHHGSCGTCACLINGTERLACMTFLTGLPEGPLTIEPLRGFPLVADLVVDISSMVQRMPVHSYLRESGTGTGAVPPDSIAGWTRFEDCIECGSCMSACPVSGPFIGPAPLAAVHRELSKREEPEEIEELRAAAYGPEGVDACESHFACSRVCPAGVAPGKHITQLRREADAL